MDGPMVGSAQQGQVRKIGRTAVQPMVEMMGVTPGQGPITAWEDTAAVADGQGGPLGRLDNPGRPTDFQGLAGGATQGRGELRRRGSQVLLKVGQRARVPGCR
jgi:hypothetical protein